mmetsp:Transcript_2979/g.6764  ORF Transcript_2979/g.6764 Transcript_2979/m.6764 type:complete len:359 (+) Transcript_2979:568-1644(+)
MLLPLLKQHMPRLVVFLPESVDRMHRLLHIPGFATQRALRLLDGVPQRLHLEAGDSADEVEPLPVSISADALREPFLKGGSPDDNKGTFRLAADGSSSRLPLHKPKLSKSSAAPKVCNFCAQVRVWRVGVEAFRDVTAVRIIQFQVCFFLWRPEATAAAKSANAAFLCLVLYHTHVVQGKVPWGLLGCAADVDADLPSQDDVTIHGLITLAEEDFTFSTILHHGQSGQTIDRAWQHIVELLEEGNLAENAGGCRADGLLTLGLDLLQEVVLVGLDHRNLPSLQVARLARRAKGLRGKRRTQQRRTRVSRVSFLIAALLLLRAEDALQLGVVRKMDLRVLPVSRLDAGLGASVLWAPFW